MESILSRDDVYVGMPVLYYKGDNHIELGIIKSFNSEGIPFVQYHTGSTAACTPYYLLRPIKNDYAFQIIKKDVNKQKETSKAIRMTVNMMERMDQIVQSHYNETLFYHEGGLIPGAHDEIISELSSIIENYKEVK